MSAPRAVHARLAARLAGSAGQGMAEFAMVLPLLVVLALGVTELGYALLDQHVVTRLTREGSNLISRDATLLDAATAMTTMSTTPVNLGSDARVIFSVIRRGATVGTPNYDQNILYQRYEFGGLSGFASKLRTSGTGSFSGAPDYQALNSDTDTRLRLTNVPPNLVTAIGGMIYVTEIYATHQLLTPLFNFGTLVPDTLYSIAYF